MQEVIITFVKQHVVEIIWILILLLLGKVIVNSIVKHFIKLADDGDDSTTSKKEKRAKTLGHIIQSIGNVAVYSVISFMLLGVFDVDIKPILASAGIVGLAVGFGAKSLVKDVIAGLFILIENQYGVGDKVKIGSFEGKVIKITMRSTVLKNAKGHKYYISNGLIKDVINMSQRKKS